MRNTAGNARDEKPKKSDENSVRAQHKSVRRLLVDQFENASERVLAAKTRSAIKGWFG